MLIRDIERNDWPVFFDCFSRQHEGWLGTVEIFDPQAGPQIQVRDQPLAGITAEAQPGGAMLISILFGRAPDTHVAHLIPDATHVRVNETASGALEALRIESVGGVTTRLKFRSVVAPELVDGVMAA